MTDTSGPGSPTPFAFYDPDTSSWRTSQLTLDSASTPSSLTLPASGSMRSGALYERPTPEAATSAPDSSSTPLLATPKAHPSGADYAKHANPTREASGDSLITQLSKVLLPTPTAAQPGGTPEAFLARKEKHPCGQSITDLRMALEVQLRPTPTAADGDRTSTTYSRGNPTLPGAISAATSSLSEDGSDSTDPPLTLWTDEP